MTIQRIVIGITASIAAYKACEVIRLLRTKGYEVRAVMTEQAQHFITPLTVQALCGHPVYRELMDPAAEAAMGHIELARWADLLLIAPATADSIAKIAHGFAGDLLTTVCLASRAPLIIVPAMNQQMFHHVATQHNLHLLKERGVIIVGPDSGAQACGDIGLGRMVEASEVVQCVATFNTSKGLLRGKTVLITAGPTREPVDPIRYISNRSSGKMGFALAQAAQEAGARVILIAGPTHCTIPFGVEAVSVETAQEMYEAVLNRVTECDIFIAAAAVADYQPTQKLNHKLKKQQTNWLLDLERTPDIVQTVASLKINRPFCVGFAAETEQGEYYAQLKLKQKCLDMIALNIIGEPGVGFDTDTNALTVFSRADKVSIPLGTKLQVAKQFIQLVGENFYAQSKTENLKCTDR